MGSSSDLYRVLDECIAAVGEQQATVGECLLRYPEYRAELQHLLPLASALQQVPRVEPPAAFRDVARQRLLAQLPSTHGNVTGHPAGRINKPKARSFAWKSTLSVAWIAAIAVIASLLAGGGIAYAADAAAPGDALYSLDRLIEHVRLQLTSNPQAAFELQLALATERLDEADDRLSKAKQDRFTQALNDYDASVALLAETIRSSAASDQAVLGGLLDEAIASHDALLANMAYDGRTGDTIQTHDRWCSGDSTEEHPVARVLADKWSDYATYDDIIAWFCAGYGLGEINLAHRISAETETPVTVDELFLARTESGWGLILQGAGLIGRPDAAGPPDGAPQGPPDNMPQGPSDAAPQGPVDEVGPPVDVPQGPPARDGDGEDPGPPEGVPNGRPADKGLAPGQEKDKP